jgi:hypothetical protein
LIANIPATKTKKRGIKMSLKQVQLKELADKQLIEICKSRKANGKSGGTKKDAVSDAIALLYKKECK